MSAIPEKSLSALLDERRTFPPPEDFRRQANANDPAIYERALRDPEAFWAAEAKNLDWFTPWQKVLEWNAPWAKWFIGGKLNVTYNCVDRHAHSPRRNKAAIIWEGEPGDSRVLTYGMLEREVNRFANALRSLDVRKGDRVREHARIGDRDADGLAGGDCQIGIAERKFGCAFNHGLLGIRGDCAEARREHTCGCCRDPPPGPSRD